MQAAVCVFFLLMKAIPEWTNAFFFWCLATCIIFKTCMHQHFKIVLVLQILMTMTLYINGSFHWIYYIAITINLSEGIGWLNLLVTRGHEKDACLIYLPFKTNTLFIQQNTSWSQEITHIMLIHVFCFDPNAYIKISGKLIITCYLKLTPTYL